MTPDADVGNVPGFEANPAEPMLREQVNDTLKHAMKARDERTVSTLRLVKAAIKDRDISVRSKGNVEGIADDEILSLLQSMIRQRRESIDAFTQGGRDDLVAKEEAEIEIIQRFLPEPLSDERTDAEVAAVIAETGATNLKQMGQVMAALRERFPGRMDFARASAIVKEKLG